MKIFTYTASDAASNDLSRRTAMTMARGARIRVRSGMRLRLGTRVRLEPDTGSDAPWILSWHVNGGQRVQLEFPTNPYWGSLLGGRRRWRGGGRD